MGMVHSKMFWSLMCLCLAACEPIEDGPLDVDAMTGSMDVSRMDEDARMTPLDASPIPLDTSSGPIDASSATQDQGAILTSDMGPDASLRVDGGQMSSPDSALPMVDGGSAPDLDMNVVQDMGPALLDAEAEMSADQALRGDAAPLNPLDEGIPGPEVEMDAGAPNMPPRCGANLWYCEQSQHCIPRRYLCDGSDDCEFVGEDESPEVCVPGMIPERCFAERPFDDLPVACYTGCWNGRGCPADHLCIRSNAGEICVRDCRALGCPRNLLCQANGYCTVDPAYLLIGAECASHQECGENRDCGGWGEIPGKDVKDPPLVVWMPVEQLRIMSPNVTARCRGTCEECRASAGTTWCIDGGCGPCDHFDNPPDAVQGQCELQQSLCWSGACECLDTQTGLCLIPAR